MDGYARGLGYLCTECSDERRGALIAAVVVIVVLVVVAVMMGVHSFASDTRRATSQPCGCGGRFRRMAVHQSLKIMVVSWQIVTQASTCVAPAMVVLD